MNLSVLKYAAALAVPFVASSVASTIVAKQLQKPRTRIKSSEWVNVQIEDETIKVLSVRL